MGNIQAELPNMQVPINYNALLKSDNIDPQVKTLLEFEAYLLKTLFLDPIFLESAMSGAALFDNDEDNSMISMIFNTIGVSDGISMGTDGMRYSLPSRELIADSIETVMNAQHYDGLITIPGCDKNLPGSLMGMIRVNRPSIMCYGGSIKPGHYNKNGYEKISKFIYN